MKKFSAIIILSLSLLFSFSAFAAEGEHEHVFGELIVTMKPTCELYGAGYRVCTNPNCEFITYENIDPLGHDFSEFKPNNDATCMNNATESKICSKCNYNYRRIIPNTALGHTYTKTEVTKKATCKNDEEQKGTCTRCLETQTFIVEGTKKPHSPGTFIFDKNSTCITDGTKTASCTYCGEKITVTAENTKVPHSYNDVVTVDPTCTEDGKISRTCTVCGFHDETVLKASGHQWVTEFKTEPTCTEEGISSCIKCKACSEIFGSEPQIIPALGHDPVSSVDPATVGKNGYKIQSCARCEKILSTNTIYRPEDFVVFGTGFLYDGMEKLPVVSVATTKGEKLIEGTDYTVTPLTDKKSVGTHQLLITLMNLYSGTKTLEYTILPGVTSSLSASPLSDTQISLNWKSVPEATGYKVYRYDSVIGKWVLLKKTAETSYTVKKLDRDTSYTFAVKAYKTDSEGKTYDSKSYVTVKGKTHFLGSTSSIKSSPISSSKVKLTWKAVKGADTYKIFRFDEKAKKWIALKTTKNLSIEISSLNSGTVYSFAVKAYRTDKNGKLKSAETFSTINGATRPDAPKNLKATAKKASATLSWTKSNADGYEIYIKKDGKAVKLSTTTKTAYTAKNLPSGKITKLYVRAYKNTSAGTVYSEYSTISVKAK